MYPNVKKILRISANNLDEINDYLSKGAILLGKDTIQTSEFTSEISCFYIGLIYST